MQPLMLTPLPEEISCPFFFEKGVFATPDCRARRETRTAAHAAMASSHCHLPDCQLALALISPAPRFSFRAFLGNAAA
jgi:hypothetical protein